MAETRLKTRILRLKRIEQALITAGDAGLGVADLMKLTDCNRRTIYRDILFLSVDLSIPIYKEGARFCVLGEYESPFPGVQRFDGKGVRHDKPNHANGPR